jgi:hypothetical protein
MSTSSTEILVRIIRIAKTAKLFTMAPSIEDPEPTKNIKTSSEMMV